MLASFRLSRQGGADAGGGGQGEADTDRHPAAGRQGAGTGPGGQQRCPFWPRWRVHGSLIIVVTRLTVRFAGRGNGVLCVCVCVCVCV